MTLGEISYISLEEITNRWVFLELLGEGTFGKVTAVWDKKDLCKRAIKTFKDDEENNLGEMSMCEISYQMLLTQRNAPNVVPVLDLLFGTEGQIAMLMPLFETDVADDIDEKNFDSWEKGLVVVRDALHGLVYLHGFKPALMHRDLKPENLLRDASGKTYLTDFGFMRFTAHGVSEATEILPCHGSNQRATRTYSAPEMVKNGTYHDEKVDIWALGVITHEIRQNSRLKAETDKSATRYLKKLHANVWKNTDPIDNLLLNLLSVDPLKRCSAVEALRMDALNLGNSEIPPETDSNTIIVDDYTPIICVDYVRIWSIMEKLDYGHPQTFYASADYIGTMIDIRWQSCNENDDIYLMSVIVASKMYEHTLWDFEDLSLQFDLKIDIVSLTNFEKSLLHARKGSLLIPFFSNTSLFEKYAYSSDLFKRKLRKKNKRNKKDATVDAHVEE